MPRKLKPGQRKRQRRRAAAAEAAAVELDAEKVSWARRERLALQADVQQVARDTAIDAADELSGPFAVELGTGPLLPPPAPPSDVPAPPPSGDSYIKNQNITDYAESYH